MSETVAPIAELRWVIVAATALAAFGCGGSDDPSSGEATSSPAAVASVIEEYLEAVADGDGRRACSKLTKNAQLGIYDFRLVHASPAHVLDACRKLVEHNRLRGREELDGVRVEDVRITGTTAVATVAEMDVDLQWIDDAWKIDSFGVAEGAVPGNRPPPPQRDVTLE